MKELDILLSRYMDERFCAAPPAEQEAFRGLLECPDPEIYAYCLGQERPPERLAVLIGRITATPSGVR
jgi:succinate dehydrogenase flavin-adding protein (antitoxin of CptAB toxin-antitoxin module)